MTDRRDVGDPARNYTVPENQPLGARISEYVIRQLIGQRLRDVAKEADKSQGLLDELFAFWPDETRKQIKTFFREHPNIQCIVNWPSQDIHLPYVAVINQGEEEDSNFVFLGDVSGIARYGMIGDDGTVSMREQRGFGMRCTLEVVVASQDPVLTMILHYLVKYFVFAAKYSLSEHYDIHNLSISGKDLAFDERMFPEFGYLKSVTLQFQTIFDFNLSEIGSKIVDVGIIVDAPLDGKPHLTKIPEGE